ncbi:MAG: type II toxin-antitoxin system RelE/ParE family toxin [Bacteroidetes bacterium]|nr:type II toxin-antitoxin system RelE/ParE family toxin [Bacteroidota bacterium]
MSYQISIRKKALEALEKIDEPSYTKIKAAIINLAEDPRPVGCKKLKGRSGYRVRVGDYRIIYEVMDKVLLIEVVQLGHRKDIYQ